MRPTLFCRALGVFRESATINLLNTYKMQFILIDHCLPDYFSGHHLPTIQIPVFSNMRCGQVLEEINDELNQCDIFDAYTDEMIKQANDNFKKEFDLRTTFVRIDADDKKALKGDFCEPAYLFFVIGEVEHKPPFTYAVNREI